MLTMGNDWLTHINQDTTVVLYQSGTDALQCQPAREPDVQTVMPWRVVRFWGRIGDVGGGQGRVHGCTLPPSPEPSATMPSPGARVGWESLTLRKMVVRSERAPELATCQVNTVSRSVVLGNASERSITTVRAWPSGAKPIA